MGMVPSERPTKGLLQLSKRSRPDKEKQDPHTRHCCENSTSTSGLIGRETCLPIKSSQHCRREQLRPRGVSLPHSMSGALPGPCAGVRHAQHPRAPLGSLPQQPRAAQTAQQDTKLSSASASAPSARRVGWSSPIPSHQPSPTHTHQIPGNCCPCQHLAGRGPQLCDHSWLPGAAGCVS